jgi:hypothetical protein
LAKRFEEARLARIIPLPSSHPSIANPARRFETPRGLKLRPHSDMSAARNAAFRPAAIPPDQTLAKL